MRRCVLLVAAVAATAALALIPTACGKRSTEAAPDKPVSEKSAPAVSVAPIAADRLCVTKGAAAVGGKITEPTMRAVALGSGGDAASLSFTYQGDTAAMRDLASGETYRQLGLKLRAQDGCNLVYVMWRIDPKPGVWVSVKRNPGKRNNKECGTEGYTRIKPVRKPALARVPELTAGASHTLRAEISGDELHAWIDDQLVWRGALPAGARELAGPAGLRSDNVSFDLVSFEAGGGSPSSGPSKCEAQAGD